MTITKRYIDELIVEHLKVIQEKWYFEPNATLVKSNKIDPLNIVPDEAMMGWLKQKYPEERNTYIENVSKAINLFKDMTDQWDYKTLSRDSMLEKFKHIFSKIFHVQNMENAVYHVLKIAKQYFNEWYGSGSEYSYAVNKILNDVNV